MLGTTLRAIVSQRLIPRTDGHGRIVVAEILVNTEAVQEKLVEPDHADEVLEIMAEGAFYGMQTIDQAITSKYESDDISFADALTFVAAPREFKIAAGIGQKAAS